MYVIWITLGHKYTMMSIKHLYLQGIMLWYQSTVAYQNRVILIEWEVYSNC